MLTLNPRVQPANIQEHVAKLLSQGENYGSFRMVDEVKILLAKAQGNRCAYCERRVRVSNESNVKLEHFHPRNHPDLASDETLPDACRRESGSSTQSESQLAWANWLLVCCGSYASDKGRRTGFEYRTCDTLKAEKDICHFIANPGREDLHTPTQLRVSNDGTATYYTNNSDAETIINDVLNLNHETLKRARRLRYSSLQSALTDARHDFKTKHRNSAVPWRKFLDRLYDSEINNEYGSVVISFIDEVKRAKGL